ncbi:MULTISPECIES: TetR/AcrR family transcriptional regulator [unclassified Ruegeria]|uniref:TetR/AcrR family transcriptional regulator n=1 Tax=unclassified Ruegeria TaxID=2625375 RepID=UPI001489DB4F|nr:MULTISPECIES: TetR/AcrR family transcriptional regulator [unclassified Ruegeria]NOD48074.1 TetR family transcriptional regulator [Ruegeria sp. HKCCD5849]NOD53058.1 TetR family transcriptional regulator [Ruegeria sp. HKCCD5851]NOD69204.1 TetR family transcriptional regulator [Ruegeria sp. HKCCD7303]NOE35090.1 TetR family transcriptional regulator [Ruegeria sp. HKCCD7318]
MSETVTRASPRNAATKEDWILLAYKLLNEGGVSAIKIVPMAKRLNLTSGSFYWHFKNVRELLDEVLRYWEQELTDNVIEKAKAFEGSPEDRILLLMKKVIEENAAVPDHAVSVWANTDQKVKATYQRTIGKRFRFAAWMFEQAGFSVEDAKSRGRLMVTSLMGDSSTGLKEQGNWEEVIEREHAILIGK